MEEDIYEDLDNFEHITGSDEIKKENIALHETVKELTDELNKLREAYRSQSEVLEKLQRNFNSLLKTAQAELERKTEMISSLNMEKDQLIFRQIGNRNTRFRRYNRNAPSESCAANKGIKRKLTSPKTEQSKAPRMEVPIVSSDAEVADGNDLVEKKAESELNEILIKSASPEIEKKEEHRKIDDTAIVAG